MEEFTDGIVYILLLNLDEEEEIIFLDESRVASPPVPSFSERTTPAFRPGVDIQGIPWELSAITREDYRLQRMREYTQLELRREPNIYVGSDLKQSVEESPPLFQFTYRNRAFPATAQHYQLRHLLSTPTLSSVYYTYGSVIMEWDPISNMDTRCMAFRDSAGAHSKVSTLCATRDLIIAGGYFGELLMRRTSFDDPDGSNQQSTHLRRVTNDENGITNMINPYHPTFPERFLVASNDGQVRMYDAKADKVIPLIHDENAANAARIAPNGKILCVASDSNQTKVFDLLGDSIAYTLTGHIAFIFSCDWHPSGNLLATGSEDHTCRIFDLRQPSQSLYVLGSRMAPVRNVRFSPDGEGSTLAVMEESDFVTFYNVQNDFSTCTTIDFFSETSGIDYSPDGRFCYIGCTESEIGGILETRRPIIPSLSSLLI